LVLHSYFLFSYSSILTSDFLLRLLPCNLAV
jgi:hypothetical protein